MKTTRLVMAAGAAGLFVAGLLVGAMLGDGGGRAATRERASRPGHDAPAGTWRTAEAGAETTITAPAQLGGDETSLRARIWSILVTSDENARDAEWLRLLPMLGHGDMESVRDLFRKLEANGLQDGFAWATFWQRWGELDGAGAMEDILTKEDPATRAHVAMQAMRGWAQKDPAVARAWLAAHAGEDFYNEALHGYVDGLARQDLERATGDAIALGKGHDLSNLPYTLTEQVVRQRGVQGMLDWWSALSDDATGGSFRQTAMEAVFRRLEGVNPGLAQEWATTLAPTAYRNDDVIGRTAANLAAKDPAAAVAWVASLPPSPADGHYTAITRTMRTWMDHDPAAANAWVAALPASPLREQASAAREVERDSVESFALQTYGDQMVTVTNSGKLEGGSQDTKIHGLLMDMSSSLQVEKKR